MNSTYLETIKDKKHLFQVWEREKTRFEKLFGNLSNDWLEKKIVTSDCGHTFGQHIACMLGWMETALTYFHSRKRNRKTLEITDVVKFTNELLKKYKSDSYLVIWKKLKATDAKFRKIIVDWDEKELFNDKDLWEWLVWSSFGHYDEHSTELEDQLADKTSVSKDKEWIHI